METLQGSQRPRLESRPDSVGSFGDRVVAFAAAAGVQLDDWQEYVLWALFDVTADSRWAADEFGLLVARQNGKGEILVAYDLAHLFLFPRPDGRRKTVLHTAHEMKTSTDAFQRLSAVIQASDDLMSMVHNVYSANGQEGIVLKPRPGQIIGDRIRFIARSRNSGRGFSADTMVYDEAQELSGKARQALKYTQSAVPNQQEVYVGTVPDELNDSEVFEGVRDRGRAGSRPRTAWMEWTPEGSEDPERAPLISSTDPNAWVASNPTLGNRIGVDTVQSEIETATDPEEPRRERLSIWPGRREEAEQQLSELDMERWTLGEKPDGKLDPAAAVIAIAVGRGGAFATVAAASRLGERIFVEHKKTERFTLWLSGYVKKLKAELGNATVVIDDKNASAIVTDLDKAGIKYLRMNLNEVAGAHTMFVEHVNTGLVVHRGQKEVTASLKFATTRKVGNAGVTWDQSDPTKPISQAQAVTWALWGLKKSESSPKPDVPPPPPQAEIVARDDLTESEVNLAVVQF